MRIELHIQTFTLQAQVTIRDPITYRRYPALTILFQIPTKP
jgi:hypothetical protein